MTPAEECRAAAARLRDDRNCDGHNVDSPSRELLAMIAALLRAREPLAQLLDGAAEEMEADADAINAAPCDNALTLARAVLADARPGHVQGAVITDRLLGTTTPATVAPRA
jgi:hypothetical protein